MLLSIDPEKVRRELAASLPYTVTSATNFETPVPSCEAVSTHICSTTTAMPADIERARDRLLTLRQRLIEKGNRPLSREALEREIDETRGRSR